MHWRDQLYKTLDIKYKEELEKYNISSEEIIRDMWIAIRRMITDDSMQDILIHYFGTFSVRIGKLFNLMFYQKMVIDEELLKETPNEAIIKRRKNLLLKCLKVYNYKVENEHQKRKHNIAQSLIYNEKENNFYGKSNQLVENPKSSFWRDAYRKKQSNGTVVS